MLPDRVSNPGPLTYESGALPIALYRPAGKILEHKISWKVLKIFPQKCSNDDLGLTLTFLMARSNLLSRLS